MVQIEDILVPALVFDQSTPVSKAIAAFTAKAVSEAVVVAGKRYLGVLYARDIAIRHGEDPHTISIRHFVTPVKPAARLDVSSLLNTIMINDYKSVPVREGSHFLTNLGLLAVLQGNPAFSISAKELMRTPYCIHQDDTVAAAISLARAMKIERIPVIDSNERVKGIVTTVSLLRAWVERRRPTRGEAVGSITHLLDLPVSSLAGTDFIVATPATPLSSIITSMIKACKDTVFVEEKGRIVGIITPKTILRLVGQEVQGATVSLSGLRVIESFEREEIDRHLHTFLNRISAILPVEYLAMHAERQSKGGVKTRYTIHARLITEKGFFFAQADDWHLVRAINSTLNILRREVEKKHQQKKL